MYIYFRLTLFYDLSVAFENTFHHRFNHVATPIDR